MTDKVLLIGMSGAGVSSVGAAVAIRLGWTYLDNDAMLLRTAGSLGPEILATQGESALREAESRVLTLMLGMPGPMVGGVPGGVVLELADRERLATSDAHVVWLRASVPVLARRSSNGSRAGQGDAAAALRKLAAERNAHYEYVADQIVDVDALPVGAIAKLVVAALVSAPELPA